MPDEEMMRIRRVVFTGDFLRPSWDGQRPTQHYNIQWCHDLLAAQIRAATGLPVEMIAWNAGGVVSGQLDHAAISSFYNVLGLPRTIAAWANIYDEAVLPEAAQAFLAAQFRDALVVAFELPPYLEHVLRRYGIPFVDIIIHPVRFLDDIFFGIRSSNVVANEIIARHAISEEFMYTIAGLQTAGARRLADFVPEHDSTLLLLQTRYDRTQIRDGAFIGAIDYLPEIERHAGSCGSLLVKDHPLDPNTRHAAAVMNAFSKAEMTDSNVYKLFANDHIRTVLTLSSSTGIEARYFGKDCHFLYKHPNAFALDGAVPAPDEFVGVFDAFLAPDFWRNVLAPLVRVTGCSGVTVPFKPNRLRISIKSFWNFNEIDSDFVVQLAAGKSSASMAPKPAPAKISSSIVVAGTQSDRHAGVTMPRDLRASLRLGPTTARRDDDVIEISPGQSGHAVFGPYLKLESGSYRIALTFELLESRALFPRTGRLVIEITTDGGANVLAGRQLTTELIKNGAGDQNIDFAMPAEHQGKEVELRVWTDGRRKIVLRRAMLSEQLQ